MSPFPSTFQAEESKFTGKNRSNDQLLVDHNGSGGDSKIILQFNRQLQADPCNGAFVNKQVALMVVTLHKISKTLKR